MAEPLLNHLLKGDLLLMDRGFWSYGLFCRIVQRDAFFAIREFSQAHLKRVQTLGPKDTLVSYAPTDKKMVQAGPARRNAAPSHCLSSARLSSYAPWSPTLRIPN